MTATHALKRTAMTLGVIGLGIALSSPASAQAVRPPCSTSGPVKMTQVDPALYSYTLGEAGSKNFTFTVSSPDVQTTGNCNASLPPVFGNGNGANPEALPLTVDLDTIEVSGVPVDGATDAALRAALSEFATAPFLLSPPGTGNQEISFVFTNSVAVPVGTYDLTVKVGPSETGVGVGTASRSFVIQVEEPQAQDTLPPTVNIIAPSTGDVIKLNNGLQVSFTAIDPPEGGAGTGVTAVRATISTSCNDDFFNLSSSLNVNPDLPVAADTTVGATTSVDPWLYVGDFTLTAEADDNAEHPGSATATFTAGTNIAPLPPISVPNRQFNSGSTLPIKFAITDGAGALMPPMDGLVVKITTPSDTTEERVAGSGATNVRWETDEFGNAVQYITNYVIPATGTYKVEVLVSDVCGAAAPQGSFTFVSADRGGKK